MNDRHPRSPDAIMPALPGSPIFIHWPAIDLTKLLVGELVMTTFHEMIHVWGDVQYDGIIRTNWCGVAALVALLARP